MLYLRTTILLDLAEGSVPRYLVSTRSSILISYNRFHQDLSREVSCKQIRLDCNSPHTMGFWYNEWVGWERNSDNSWPWFLHIGTDIVSNLLLLSNRNQLTWDYRKPKPFSARLIPRSRKHINTILRDWQIAYRRLHKISLSSLDKRGSGLPQSHITEYATICSIYVSFIHVYQKCELWSDVR